MKQVYKKYTEEDFKVWRILFERQVSNLQGKSCFEYLSCLNQMNEVLNPNEVPNFDKLNKLLLSATGWKIEVVPGLIPVDEFFRFLSQKKFCSSTWLRKMEQLDYLEEPDMFHDIFGHIPLFMNKNYAAFAQKMGDLGVKYSGNDQIVKELQRIYWFTVEFGLVKEQGTKIYGAGIISSFGETNFVYTDEPEIVPFKLEDVIATDFSTSEIQTKYFLLESMDELYDIFHQYEILIKERGID